MSMTYRSQNPSDFRETGASLEIRSVSKTFRPDVFKPAYKAVNQLNLNFKKGVCTGLLGHNGAGKTTTIRMILGLITPESGSIYFDGQPIRTEDKKHIGYMPEVNKLHLNITVEESLTRSLKIYDLKKELGKGERQKKIEAKLQGLGLIPHRRKKVRELSKGLARRLAFAQATIHEPRLLILDEPSTGLDPHASEVLIENICEEKRKGTTIILCTHELGHISSLCDHFYIMRQGQLVAQSMTLEESTGVEDIDWGSAYNIQVTDLAKEQVKDLQTAHSLPLWESLRTEDDSATISFVSYSDAEPWLSIFLGKNFKIKRFTEGHSLTATQIQKFFRGQK